MKKVESIEFDDINDTDNFFDNWDFEEEEEINGSEPIGSYNSFKFKPGDRVEHNVGHLPYEFTSFGTGIVINKTLNNERMEIIFDNRRVITFVCDTAYKNKIIKKIG